MFYNCLLILFMFPFTVSNQSTYINQPNSTNFCFPSQIVYLQTDGYSIFTSNLLPQNIYLQNNFIVQTVKQSNEDQNLVKTQASVAKVRETLQNQSSLELSEDQEQNQISPEIKTRQKYGRNINSNIFHHMLKNISAGEMSINTIKILLQKLNSFLSIQQFLQLFNKKLGKIKTYVSHQRIKDIFKGVKPSFIRNRNVSQKELEFLKIFRILSRNYLKNSHITYVFNSLKIKDKSKILHIQGARKIVQLMR